MKLALIGFGTVGKAFARLIESKKAAFPFRITGIHTARHGTAINPEGLKPAFAFGPAAPTVEAFLDACRPEIAVEITPLNPATGEPAISHIRMAFARGVHVATANKGPIAHAYGQLREEAARAGVEFRFEATVMDGAPVFNLVRRNLPGVRVLGFTAVLNSTTKIIIEAMERGRSFEDGVRQAQQMGVAEADPSYDIDGWDAAAKAAALANVLMDAHTTPLAVDTKGVGRVTPEKVAALAAKGKTIQLVARARSTEAGVKLRVRAEVLEKTDLLAAVRGTSNLLLLHTDLMGTVGTVSISPTPEQTAYGLFADIVDIAQSI